VPIGSVAMLWGYFSSWLKGLPRYNDLEFRRFNVCLRMGKRAAMAQVNAERAHLRHASHPAPGSPMKRTKRTDLRGLSFNPSTPCRWRLGWPRVHAIDLISLTGFRQIAVGLLPA
jgi:hypothetical protein